jgi:mannose/fructose/N-acetylgalactosamine-specific phosphotransferase system component IIC
MLPPTPKRRESRNQAVISGLVVAPLIAGVLTGALMGDVLAGIAAGVIVAGLGASIAFAVHRVMLRSQ